MKTELTELEKSIHNYWIENNKDKSKLISHIDLVIPYSDYNELEGSCTSGKVKKLIKKFNAIKVDTYTVSKDFILEAHESACSTLKTKIENQFPELFPKVELELNKWYKSNLYGKKLYYFTAFKQADGYLKRYYYGFSDDVFKKDYTASNDLDKSWTLATKEEVKTALKNEWKKIAKKYDYSVKTLDGYELHECGFEIVYNFTENKAYLNSSEYQCIFDNGKWAEIISEPIELSLDEIAEKFGVDVSLIKIKK